MSYKLLYCALFLSGIICLRLQFIDYRVIRYNDYLRRFNKSYSAEEFQRRLLYFEESLEEIQKLNNGPSRTGAVHGLTKFSDWSKQEFAEKFSLKKDYCVNEHIKCYLSKGPWSMVSLSVFFWEKHSAPKVVPDKFDWRDQVGVIGPVDNQKECNGCWAFGIVRVMESMAAIGKIGYDRLSVQQLLDCSDVNKGCTGGNIDTGMKNLCLNHYKITTEDRYPLLLDNQRCKLPMTSGRGIKSMTTLCNVDNDDIINKLLHGPVMAVVNPASWLNYNSGVIQRNCFSDYLGIVHVVLIVGYDTSYDENEEPVPYYIVKNTWGTDWGEGGYIRIAMDKKNNLCGIYNHIGALDVL